jgi:release factor glutamine methyltransferase
VRASGTDELVRQLRAAGCVFAEDEAALLLDAAAGDGDVLCALRDRRLAGEPLEHVVGWAEFCGARMVVRPGVFVPRPRTEALVEHALELVRGAERLVVVDLCCGSGALGASVVDSLCGGSEPGGSERGRSSSDPSCAVELHAADVDPRACACARVNVEPRGGHVHEGDLDAPLPHELRGRVDLLLANVPYVATGDIETLPREAREHEPLATLDGGADGLDLARRVAGIAPGWLVPGGHVLVEVTAAQAPVLAAGMERAGLVARVHRDDELDATVVVGTREPEPREPR